VSCVALTNVVARLAWPVHCTVAPEMKFVPLSVNVNVGPPALPPVGLIELRVGAALIVNVTVPEVPPAAGLVTEIDGVPTALM